MDTLIKQRCFNHGFREAAARCPDCGRFFCRECVTEHDDRVLCATCLSKKAMNAGFGNQSSGIPVSLTLLLSGGLILWLVFYYLGIGLMKIPQAFHEGTLWRGLF